MCNSSVIRLRLVKLKENWCEGNLNQLSATCTRCNLFFVNQSFTFNFLNLKYISLFCLFTIFAHFCSRYNLNHTLKFSPHSLVSSWSWSRRVVTTRLQTCNIPCIDILETVPKEFCHFSNSVCDAFTSTAIGLLFLRRDTMLDSIE